MLGLYTARLQHLTATLPKVPKDRDQARQQEKNISKESKLMNTIRISASPGTLWLAVWCSAMLASEESATQENDSPMVKLNDAEYADWLARWDKNVINGRGAIATATTCARMAVHAPTHRAATYLVDQGNPVANDNNPGTAAQPWKSIQKAADMSKPATLSTSWPAGMTNG